MASQVPIYDLTLSDDEVDRRSATPGVPLHTQVIDLTYTSDEAPIGGAPSAAAGPVNQGKFSSPLPQTNSHSDLPGGVLPAPLLPPTLLIQPLSLYWKMILNHKMNTYPASRRPVLRDRATTLVTSRGLHGQISLSVGDFCGLTMIRDRRGYLNDNIMNAFLQTLDQAVRKATASPNRPPRHVFLSTYAAATLRQAADGNPNALQQLQRTLAKHGVTPANLAEVQNIYFPIHITTGAGHWVLAVWHPHRAAMTWYDSLVPDTGPRPQLKEVSQCLQKFWTQSVQPSPDPARWTHRAVRCPQQHNGSDCGVYVLATCLFRVLQYGRFVTGQGKQNLLRNYFAAVLVQGGWGGELPWGWPSPTTLPPHYYTQEVVPGSAGYMV